MSNSKHSVKRLKASNCSQLSNKSFLYQIDPNKPQKTELEYLIRYLEFQKRSFRHFFVSFFSRLKKRIFCENVCNTLASVPNFPLPKTPKKRI